MSNADFLQDLRNHINASAAITPEARLRNYVKTTCLTREKNSLSIVTSLEDAQSYIGKEVGVTKWFPISQKRVNRFAEATGDYQFIHIDSSRASAETCYSGTIAYGMLIMSLIPTFATHGTLKISGTNQCIIYGLDRVRFLNPVKIGQKIRGRFTLLSAQERNVNEMLMRHAVSIEIEGEDKPALIADWIVMAVL
jgi:acyl dehydratase